MNAIELNEANREAYRTSLRAGAAERRKAAFDKFKKQKELDRLSRRGKVSEPNKLLLEIRNQLVSLTNLLNSKGRPAMDEVPVSFEVTERDKDGHVKAFKAFKVV